MIQTHFAASCTGDALPVKLFGRIARSSSIISRKEEGIPELFFTSRRGSRPGKVKQPKTRRALRNQVGARVSSEFGEFSFIPGKEVIQSPSRAFRRHQVRTIRRLSVLIGRLHVEGLQEIRAAAQAMVEFRAEARIRAIPSYSTPDRIAACSRFSGK